MEKIDLSNVDWDEIYRPATPEEEAELKAQMLAEKQREEQGWFDRLGFDKKWAKTPAEAKAKLIEQYKTAKAQLAVWQNKDYKRNDKLVLLGGKHDDFDICEKSITSINEARKNSRCRNFLYDMESAIEDLKKLKVPAEEIAALQA